MSAPEAAAQRKVYNGTRKIKGKSRPTVAVATHPDLGMPCDGAVTGTREDENEDPWTIERMAGSETSAGAVIIS